MSQLDDQPLDEPQLDSAEFHRMHRQTRICLWVILIGLGNFMAFVIGYSYLYGEALHGWVEQWGPETYRFFLQSDPDERREVSRTVFIYSGIHSISIWLTVGAVMLAMLTLAKERIASSMRVTIIRGRTLLTILATVITITICVATAVATRNFVQNFTQPKPPHYKKGDTQPSPTQPRPIAGDVSQPADASAE